ncbi:class A sortase [Fructilactobacillus frigidiflavus]|uniref:class A sortase n=1 Tax=Fructilactobacillus frigidiflavus TaxID=3242688 RepID=UPI003756E7B9
MATKTKKQRLKRFFNYLILLVLLVIGLGLTFNSQIESFWLGMRSNQKVSSLTKKEVKKGEAKKGNYDYKAVSAVSAKSIMESEKARHENAIGKIKYPAVGINLPIYKGLNSETLFLGAGTMKPEQQMGKGNYALASHHMDDPKRLFSPLTKAKKGQIIELSDLSKTYKYKVTSVKNVNEKDVGVVNDVPGKKQVTLITCTKPIPGITERIVVTGELIK